MRVDRPSFSDSGGEDKPDKPKGPFGSSSPEAYAKRVDDAKIQRQAEAAVRQQEADRAAKSKPYADHLRNKPEHEWNPRGPIAAWHDYNNRMREWEDETKRLTEAIDRGDSDESPIDNMGDEPVESNEPSDSPAESFEPPDKPDAIEPTAGDEAVDEPEATDKPEVVDLPKLGDLPPEDFERVVDMVRESLPPRVVPGEGQPTVGKWFRSDGTEIASIESGRWTDGQRDEMYELAQDRFKVTMGKSLIIADHLEPKLAYMAANGVTEASVVINNEPCLGRFGCDRILPRMLPEGSSLTVYGVDSAGNQTARTYRGEGQP